MDFADWQTAARHALDPHAWSYFMATADPADSADHDHAAWQQIELIPRILRGVDSVDTTATSSGCHRAARRARGKLDDRREGTVLDPVGRPCLRYS